MVRIKDLGGDFYAEKTTPRITLHGRGEAGWHIWVEYPDYRDVQYFTNEQGYGLWEIIDYKITPVIYTGEDGEKYEDVAEEPVIVQLKAEGEFRLSKDKRRAMRACRRHFTYWNEVDDREPTDSMKCGY